MKFLYPFEVALWQVRMGPLLKDDASSGKNDNILRCGFLFYWGDVDHQEDDSEWLFRHVDGRLR